MPLNHPALVDLLKQAYSAEKAASFAYQGHAGSVKLQQEKEEIRQIEMDEWEHRKEVLAIMQQYDVPVSRFYEIKYHLIGKLISWSCYVIGRFMPFYFAGRLESGNVCEYFRMINFFHELNITTHDQALYAMGIKEKEHEVYFLEKVKSDPLLPLFEKVFAWGIKESLNNIDLSKQHDVKYPNQYCKK